MSEQHKTIPWADEEYGHVTAVDGKRYPLVYYPQTMDEDGNILTYIGPGGVRFDAGDAAVSTPLVIRQA